MNFLFLKTLKLFKGSLYPIFARNVSQKPTLTPKELVSVSHGDEAGLGGSVRHGRRAGGPFLRLGLFFFHTLSFRESCSPCPPENPQN